MSLISLSHSRSPQFMQNKILTRLVTTPSKDKPYKLTDGGGLFLYVSTTGARLWRYKYRIARKEGVFSIGAYPEISLAKAREEHSKARELVKLSTHPTHDRQLKKLVEQHEAGSTFKAIAQEWISKNKGRWSPYYLKGNPPIFSMS